MPSFIELREITKTYPTLQQETLLAIRNISFEVGRGEFVSVVGASGCGKTTLLKTVAGLLPHEGEVLVVRTNGNPDYVGRCLTVPALEQATAFASYLIRLTPDISLVRPGYLAAMLNSPSVRHVLRRHVRSSAGNYNVNIGGLRATPIPLPPLDTQDSVLSQLTALRASVTECSSRIASIRELQRQVLSESEA